MGEQEERPQPTLEEQLAQAEREQREAAIRVEALQNQASREHSKRLAAVAEELRAADGTPGLKSLVHELNVLLQLYGVTNQTQGRLQLQRFRESLELVAPGDRAAFIGWLAALLRPVMAAIEARESREDGAP